MESASGGGEEPAAELAELSATVRSLYRDVVRLKLVALRRPGHSVRQRSFSSDYSAPQLTGLSGGGAASQGAAFDAPSLVQESRSLKQRVQQLQRELERQQERFEQQLAEVESAVGEVRGKVRSLESQRLEREELERAASLQMFDTPCLKLRVGEHQFFTSLATLRKHRDSMLASMFSGQYKIEKDADGFYFIDRDGSLFRHILNHLRSERSPPSDLSEEECRLLIDECHFYGISSLTQLLEKRLAPDPLADGDSMVGIRATATTRYTQSIIVHLSEATRLLFQAMTRDAELGKPQTVLSVAPGTALHRQLLTADKRPTPAFIIFLEMMKQEKVDAEWRIEEEGNAANAQGGATLLITVALLRPAHHICREVLRSFKKMRLLGESHIL